MSSLNTIQPPASNTSNKDIFALPPLKKLDSERPYLFNQKPPSLFSSEQPRTGEFDDTIRKVFPETTRKQDFKPRGPEDQLPPSASSNMLLSNPSSGYSLFNTADSDPSLTRTSNTALLNNPTQKTATSNETFGPARLHSRRPITLPHFLCDANNSLVTARDTKPSKKRLYEDTTETRVESTIRNVAPKVDKGIFASSSASPHGFFRTLKKPENQATPKRSISETGISSSKHLNDALLSSESNAQIKPVDSRPEREINKNKVRIFGYDPDEASQVVQFFSSLGEMVEQPHCEANLTVLHYHSAEAAAKAIEYNGTVFNQNRVIGVTYNGLPKDVGLKVHDSGAEIYHFNSDEQKQNNSFFKKIKSIMFGN
ncbi:hypothetical protein A0J61_07509 [Choanephora cucurbitarum]|uniref:RRM Nup35-type domain-containing protein n=1 Tax=Choanephora cucurbitarum TaxID=101091 RepID=A0A1C7N5L2_9FUNG|nr:hypothetical protein A0J61_07509 [Choanephora cucurbitarum]